MIHKYRFFIQSVCTYSALYPSANFVQQKYCRGKEEVDLEETKRYWLYGTCVSPTLVYGWQKVLNTFLPQITRPYIILKVCLDTFCFAPCVITLFFFLMGTLESKSLEQIKKEYESKFWKTYLTGMCYWSLVQTFNFRYIPFRYRTIFTSCMSFFWTITLSHIKSMSIEPKAIAQCEQNNEFA
eukprot:TRINITY_DN25928_c0_g1_i1.p1 TRINITY_DN25928_c0_g1~~TRINITY_DN25928_c0_g1_i1.p1  ORF type:complete len:183 (-),score=16.79 TRINITY_DN25928_c0_g1_i1:33-581(-)